MPLAARAEVTLGIGGSPAIATHADSAGTAPLAVRPAPIVDLDATFGDIALHGESVPYERTRSFGPTFDLSSAAFSTFGATLRAYERGHRLAFGVGYGGIIGATFGTEPPSTIANRASGIRLELLERVPLTARTTLELNLAGEPDMHGTTRTNLGIVGAKTLADAVTGSQCDASAVAVTRATRTLAFAYGLRYDATLVQFARSGKLVERESQLIPFLEVRSKL